VYTIKIVLTNNDGVRVKRELANCELRTANPRERIARYAYDQGEICRGRGEFPGHWFWIVSLLSMLSPRRPLVFLCFLPTGITTQACLWHVETLIMQI